MHSTSDPSSARQRNPWPVCITAFFIVAIAGLAALVFFCARQPVELVARDYYEQEIRYQQQIERLERTEQQKAQPTISYNAATEVISITLQPEGTGAPVTGKIHLYRPSAANLDHELELRLDAAGVQKVDTRALAPGLWKVRVSWTAQNQEYFVDQKVIIGSGKS